MSEKQLYPPYPPQHATPQHTEANSSCRQPIVKPKQIALWLAMILLASQQDLGVIADMLSILVNVFHLRQIVTSWRADDA